MIASSLSWVFARVIWPPEVTAACHTPEAGHAHLPDRGPFKSLPQGAHTANPITGDFSVECSNAFAIENGEIAGPVKKAMMSGNIYDILSNCDALKSEVKQKGSFILPKVFARDVRVVGN